ncbi:DUF6452 family protein [Flavobacterium aquicola]|uniref:Uncharacterized protein n=1 Tax=Flavobacterium aquicola TaxID=1682742 RepID=A0A3E0EU75_9FLAO|nr:DUF6452 family protein [Flavobacterium aquicola]REH01775.1 hypothetical protein C8P67_101257 [Flavobacterium aquicola]
MKKILAFLMILGFASSSCEPDDICDPTTPTTPRMKIEFYNIKIPSQLKDVDNLKVIGEGMTEGVVLNPTATGNSKYLANGNTILLPLNTEADLVKYTFILNFDNDNPLLVHEDNLEFNYKRVNSYVSRACGFKTTFDLNEDEPFILSDSTPSDPLWIKRVLVEQNNISSENETIIKIYF